MVVHGGSGPVFLVLVWHADRPVCMKEAGSHVKRVVEDDNDVRSWIYTDEAGLVCCMPYCDLINRPLQLGVV